MIRSKWKLCYGLVDLKDNFKVNNRSICFHSLCWQYDSFIYVYNGKYYLPLRNFKRNMIGYKLGEFVFTKKKCIRLSKRKKKK